MITAVIDILLIAVAIFVTIGVAIVCSLFMLYMFKLAEIYDNLLVHCLCLFVGLLPVSTVVYLLLFARSRM